MKLTVVALGLLAALLANPAHAASAQCGFIEDPDLQARCRAESGGGSAQCGFIRDADMQAHCRAMTGGGSAQCGFIRDEDRQAKSTASQRGQVFHFPWPRLPV